MIKENFLTSTLLSESSKDPRAAMAEESMASSWESEVHEIYLRNLRASITKIPSLSVAVMKEIFKYKNNCLEI